MQHDVSSFLTPSDVKGAMDLMWSAGATKLEAVTYVMCKRGDSSRSVSQTMRCSLPLTYARVRNVKRKIAGKGVENGE